MNKVKIITIACWTITAVVLIGLVAWAFVGVAPFGTDGPLNWFGNFGAERFSGPFEEQAREEITIDDINSVYINWTAGTVMVSRHEGGEIILIESAQRELRDGESFGVSTSGGTLSVEFTTRQRLRNMPAKNLEILLPQELYELETFRIRTTSANVEIDDLIVSTLIDISTVSGFVEASQIQARTLDISTTSGRIDARGVNAIDANLRSVSGRIEVENGNLENVNSRTTSGRVQLGGEFRYIYARSVSGRVEITNGIVPNDLQVNTTSGRIAISLRDEGEPLSVSYSTVSGRFTSEIPVLSGVADAQIRLSTISGRIDIYELR